MKRIFSALIGVLILPLAAQETKELPQKEIDLKEVNIQGNRLQLPFSEIARDIQVITREQIQKLPASSLNEVLSYFSGVDVRQRGPFGTQTDLSIDGGTSEQSIVLINGVKMLDAQTAHNMMNIPVPLSAIEQIEILRGAAARVYGINALTGAINVVTRKERHSSLTADLQTGSSFESKEEGDGSGIYAGGAAEFTANFGNREQRHLFALGQYMYNGQRYNSASANTRLFYNGQYDLDPDNNLQAMAGYARSRFGANGFYAAPGDRNSEEIVRSAVFSLSSSHRIGDLILSPRISNRYGEDDYRYFKDDLSKGRSLHFTNALMLELNSHWITELGTFGFGWESRLEEIHSSNIGEHQRDNHGVYGELASGLGDKLHGTIGFYANYNTDFGWQVYPGLDLAYRLTSRWRVSTSIGAGQRIPSFTDLYLDQRPGNVGNPSLQPENAWSYEASIQYEKRKLHLQAGYFSRTITDFSDWVREDASMPYSPVNLRKNRIQGLYGRIQQEFDLESLGTVGFRVSYNYLQPSLETSGTVQSKYVLESLKHQLVTGVHYQVDQFSVHLKHRWLQRELANAYAVADIRLNYHWQQLLFYTTATNLFNAIYMEAGAVPMPGRWLSIGLRYLVQ